MIRSGRSCLSTYGSSGRGGTGSRSVAAKATQQDTWHDLMGQRAVIQKAKETATPTEALQP